MSKKTMYPRKNCNVCHGAGIMLFADSFDRDNFSPCWKCSKKAKDLGKELIQRPNPYEGMTTEKMLMAVYKDVFGEDFRT